jgi:hypothetical protein
VAVGPRPEPGEIEPCGEQDGNRQTAPN